jgi:hypothetical protein
MDIFGRSGVMAKQQPHALIRSFVRVSLLLLTLQVATTERIVWIGLIMGLCFGAVGGVLGHIMLGPPATMSASS